MDSRKSSCSRGMANAVICVTFLLFTVSLRTQAARLPLQRRILLETQKNAEASSSSQAVVEPQERMNSTLSGLYEALKDLRASEVQDVDFAKTLLILEEFEVKMAEWYSREGSHERLRGVCARTLETRVNETKVLKHFLQTLNSRNPFLPASNLAIEPLSALVPLVTGPEKTTGHSPLQMPSGLIKLRSDNVLASAARAGENPQKATARYHRHEGMPVGADLPGATHGIMLSHDTDADFATIMTIIHEGVKQAAYAEIDHGVDENMRELAADVKDRAVADLEVLREVMKERMEERYAKSLSRREHIEAAARAPSST